MAGYLVVVAIEGGRECAGLETGALIAATRGSTGDGQGATVGKSRGSRSPKRPCWWAILG